MSGFQLRPYQRAAVEAVYDHLRSRDDNPCVVLPTGAGKSLVIAQIAMDAVQRWGGRVIVLAHVQELLEQNADKIRRLCGDVPVGIYSAGLGRRDTTEPVIVASIQSVYQRAEELGRFDLAIIDECHLIPTEGEGMYRTFLAAAKEMNPHVRVIGLTATPYRMKSGLICTPDHFINHVCYEAGVREMIRDGYLCRVKSRAGKTKPDTSGLHIRGGEFVAEDAEALMDAEDLVEAACEEIVDLTADRQAVLIFAAGVEHGRHVQEVLQTKHGVQCGFVCGDTPQAEREELLARFRGDPSDGLFERQPLKYLCNVNVLTTGFDAPNIDCIVLLRPTASPGLYYQMVGRGFRLHPNKSDCLVLDYGGNVLRHGPIDQVNVDRKPGNGGGPAPAKECPICFSLIAAGYARCPECDYEFPAREKEHDVRASKAGILSDDYEDVEYEVQDVEFSVHEKKNAPPDAPKSMRVSYRIGFYQWQSEWICFEHTGFARHKAEQWWRERSNDPIPATANHAVELAYAGALAVTEAITVRSIPGEKYDRIVSYKLGPKPDPVELDETECDDVFSDEEIPF